MARKKIGLVGGGNIGGVMAQVAAMKEMGDVMLLDVAEGLPQGKSLDIWEASPVWNADARVTGTNRYEDLEGCDVVIVTAGIARKPGMSRDDLLNTNLSIMKNVSENLKRYCQNAFVIVVSNPLDVMVYACQKMTGFAPNMVCGMAGVLDSARFRAFVAEAAGVSVQDVSALVLGGHGDLMVPMIRYCNIAGVPVERFLSREKIDAIVERTKKAGGEVVALLKSGSAFVSPAISALDMATSYLNDKKRVVTCAAYLNGQYGVKGYYIGVPAVIGANGVEKIVELDFTAAEKELFESSITHVKEMVDGITW